jgi:hypothetical protein
VQSAAALASLLHRTARRIAHHPVWGLLLWLVIVASLTGAVTVFGAQASNDTSRPGVYRRLADQQACPGARP